VFYLYAWKDPDHRRTRVGNVRLHVHRCDLAILLYDGYDWARTRKVIEDEIKAVRRRLERIKQLLASGQKGDEGAPVAVEEKPNSLLFNSVYIGLDATRELDGPALLAAIDEELEGLRDETATESSWQTNFPLGHPQHGPRRKPRLRGKRLTRSKKPQIEISLDAIKADLDLFTLDTNQPVNDAENMRPSVDQLASRLHLTVKEMEILDHIKTSTWKKFLGGMKSDKRGNVRETGADMVRVELRGLKIGASPGADGGEESRLKLKILPLKLHVDQDALDFLKQFFNFQGPHLEGPPVDRKPSSEPFFRELAVV